MLALYGFVKGLYNITTGNKKLINAVKSRNLAQTQSLLNNGVSPNITVNGHTLLQVAIGCNSANCLQALIHNGATLNQEIVESLYESAISVQYFDCLRVLDEVIADPKFNLSPISEPKGTKFIERTFFMSHSSTVIKYFESKGFKLTQKSQNIRASVKILKKLRKCHSVPGSEEETKKQINRYLIDKKTTEIYLRVEPVALYSSAIGALKNTSVKKLSLVMSADDLEKNYEYFIIFLNILKQTPVKIFDISQYELKTNHILAISKHILGTNIKEIIINAEKVWDLDSKVFAESLMNTDLEKVTFKQVNYNIPLVKPWVQIFCDNIIGSHLSEVILQLGGHDFFSLIEFPIPIEFLQANELFFKAMEQNKKLHAAYKQGLIDICEKAEVPTDVLKIFGEYITLNPALISHEAAPGAGSLLALTLEKMKIENEPSKNEIQGSKIKRRNNI